MVNWCLLSMHERQEKTFLIFFLFILHIKRGIAWWRDHYIHKEKLTTKDMAFYKFLVIWAFKSLLLFKSLQEISTMHFGSVRLKERTDCSYKERKILGKQERICIWISYQVGHLARWNSYGLGSNLGGFLWFQMDFHKGGTDWVVIHIFANRWRKAQ